LSGFNVERILSSLDSTTLLQLVWLLLSNL